MDNQYEDNEGKCFCEQHPGQFSCAFVPHAGGGMGSGSDWVDYSTPTGGNPYGGNTYGNSNTDMDMDIDIDIDIFVD